VGAGSAQPAAIKRGVELADIFRAYGESYRRDHPLPAFYLKVIEAVERCRTAALGGHLEQCNTCGYERPVYNSCRNRHCPKCQSLAKVKWLDKQKSELLPTGYFHLVFTLPHELNPLILVNKKPLINILFQSVWQTLAQFTQCGLGGTPGITAVPHTPGIKPCWIIFICTVWFPLALCLLIETAGSRCAKTFCFRLKP